MVSLHYYRAKFYAPENARLDLEAWQNGKYRKVGEYAGGYICKVGNLYVVIVSYLKNEK